VIRAVALLKEKGIGATLRIAGEDDSSNGQTRIFLEELIGKMSLSENVMLMGAVSEQKICRELEKAHVFVLASREEALGVATMEAMAVGVPVVATGVGGVPELVGHGKTGLLVAPGKPQEIAEAIETVITDSKLARNFSAASQKKIAACFHERISAETISESLKAAHVKP
jgi:glycosyltransferase involved in cell wall biosynthesis